MASCLFLRLLFRFLRFLPVVCWAESASEIALSNVCYVFWDDSLVAVLDFCDYCYYFGFGVVTVFAVICSILLFRGDSFLFC